MVPDRGAPWPNWVPCQVFEGDTCPLSHRGRFVGSVSSTLGVVSGEGGDKGGLPATKPVSWVQDINKTYFLILLFFLCLAVRDVF